MENDERDLLLAIKEQNDKILAFIEMVEKVAAPMMGAASGAKPW